MLAPVDGHRRTQTQGAIGVRSRVHAQGGTLADVDGRLFLAREQREAEGRCIGEQPPEQRALEIVQVEPVGFLNGEGLAGGAVQGSELREPAEGIRVQFEAVDLVGEGVPGDVRPHPVTGGAADDRTHRQAVRTVGGSGGRRPGHGAVPPVPRARDEFPQLEQQPQFGGVRAGATGRPGKRGDGGLPLGQAIGLAHRLPDRIGRGVIGALDSSACALAQLSDPAALAQDRRVARQYQRRDVFAVEGHGATARAAARCGEVADGFGERYPRPIQLRRTSPHPTGEPSALGIPVDLVDGAAAGVALPALERGAADEAGDVDDVHQRSDLGRHPSIVPRGCDSTARTAYCEVRSGCGALTPCSPISRQTVGVSAGCSSAICRSTR